MNLRVNKGLLLGLSFVFVLLIIHLNSKLPNWVNYYNKELIENNLTFELKNKKFVYKNNDDILWSTPEDWIITDFVLADIDQNTKKEIILLCWRKNDYGQYNPFWKNKDTSKYYQHLYIYDIMDNSLKPKWMSSKLKPNIKDFEINENGEFIITHPDKEVSKWKWNSFGIERID